MSADKQTKFKAFAYKLCLGGLTLLVAGFGYLYCLPKTYRADARIKIVKSGWNNTNDANGSFGPEKLPEECQIIRSNGILDQVIQNLNLNQIWGKLNNQGVVLTKEQSRARLHEMLDIHPVPSAIMVEIQVTDADPNEAANIANEITKVYCNFRQTGRENASHEGISSLRQKWEAQNQKVHEAQAELDKLRTAINTDRATNEVYDAKAIEELQVQRISLEDDYVKKQNQLSRLKDLSKDELKEVLPTIDNDPRSLLTTTLSQLIAAKNKLSAAQITPGPEAPETKSAAVVAEQLDKKVNELIDSTIAMKAAELTSMKAALNRMTELTEKSKHANTNLARFTAQDTDFAKNLEQLKKERAFLEYEIKQNGSMTAVMPGVITAEIVDVADAPTKPAFPDGRIALGAFIAGGASLGAGLFLLVLLTMKPRGAEKKAGPSAN